MTGRVGAIILAAGLSRRMGTCKQLLPLGGTTVIARCLESLLAGGAEEIIVVVGPQGDDVAEEARRHPVRIVRTTAPHGDMACSVRTGRAALPPTVSGVLIAPCDHPLVLPATVAGLLAAHHRDPRTIIIPSHGGRRGHPTCFPRGILDELDDTGTLRDLVRRDPGRLRHLDTEDQGVVLDMDTPEDYQRIVRICREGSI
ncbi:nucleotidyltransferase family protein [Oryzomonas japonica]|uniref:Nucleotidyltransferase family protein n=1 Tax=Oryzomonas japonica TaxID=2603858 RepID=A0A7J4ZW83_9BACT|nr:nucleotidyltransferase family protein [Oryzomonas japonica]KAB0667375.1 nucleotidyltransferase family protein [Oryzomonas japonica]